MKRSTPLNRTRFKAKKKDPAKVKAWQAVKEALWVRAEGMCEVPWCHRQANDAHHQPKRRRPGATNTLPGLVALCRRCHDQTDLPAGKGRLTILPYRYVDTGAYGFHFFQGVEHRRSIGPFTDEDTP